MPKQSGIAWTTFTVATNDIRGDVTSLDVSTPREFQNVTGIDKSAIERLGLLADLSITVNFVFDPDALKTHVTFRDVTSSAAKATVLTIGGKTLSANVFYTDYKLSRGDDGSLTGTSPGVLADGTVPAWS